MVALLAALHSRLGAASAADVAGFVWGLRFVSMPYSRTLAHTQMRYECRGGLQGCSSCSRVAAIGCRLFKCYRTILGCAYICVRASLRRSSNVPTQLRSALRTYTNAARLKSLGNTTELNLPIQC